MDSKLMTEFIQARSIATILYMSWLEDHEVLTKFKQSTTVPNIYYDKNWDSSTHDTFELILSFLASMRIFEEAGGTFILRDNYQLKLDQIHVTYNFDLLRNNPVFIYIKYALDLFDDKLEGGSGVWNRKNYHIIEQFYTGSLYKKIYHDFVQEIYGAANSQNRKFDNIVVIALYNDLCINSFSNQNINPLNVRLISYTEKLKKLTRSYCELCNESSQFSNSIKTINENIDIQSDLFLLPNGLGFHQSIKDLVSIIDKYAKDDCTVMGISTFDFDKNIGLEPVQKFQPDYIEYPNDDKLEKFLITKGFGKISRQDINQFIFKSIRIKMGY